MAKKKAAPVASSVSEAAQRTPMNETGPPAVMASNITVNNIPRTRRRSKILVVDVDVDVAVEPIPHLIPVMCAVSSTWDKAYKCQKAYGHEGPCDFGESLTTLSATTEFNQPEDVSLFVPGVIDILRTETVDITARVSTLTITDQDSLTLANTELSSIVALRKRIEEYHRPFKQAAWEEHKRRVADESNDLAVITEAEKKVRILVGSYLTEQNRLQQLKIEQTRREDEQRRAVELAEAERTAKQRTLEQIERLMIEQNMSYDHAVLAVNPQAQVKMAVESVPIARTVVPAVPKSANPLLPPQYSARVVDIRELCGAVHRGEVPTEYVIGNEPALNTRARIDKDGFKLPGVELVKVEGNVRVGGR